MFKRIFTVLALGAAIAATAESAEAQRPISIGISGGLAIPTSDLGDTHSMGYNATVGLGIGFPVSNAGVRFEGFYNKFAGKDRTVGAEPDVRIAGFSANLTYDLGGAVVRPYLIGGAGSYNYKPDGGSSSTEFGINAGAGVKFGLAGFSTFAEARLHTFNLDNDRSVQFIPVTFGIQF